MLQKELRLIKSIQIQHRTSFEKKMYLASHDGNGKMQEFYYKFYKLKGGDKFWGETGRATNFWGKNGTGDKFWGKKLGTKKFSPVLFQKSENAVFCRVRISVPKFGTL